MKIENIKPTLTLSFIGLVLSWVGFTIYSGFGIALAVVFGFVVINVARS